MNITIRTRSLKNGSRSIYLDFYDKGKRWTESLGLSLIPDNAPNAKRLNEAAMAKANEAKSKRMIGIEDEPIDADKPIQLPKRVLADWLDDYLNGIPKAKSTYRNTRTLINIVKSYLKHRRRPRLLMANVDQHFLLGLFDYMTDTYKNTKSSDNPKPLSPRTLRLHQTTLVRMLNQAVKDGVLDKNPFYALGQQQRIGDKETTREYLDKEELVALMDAEATNDTTKQAFIFCCLTGLRYGDVKALKWRDIKNIDGQEMIVLKKMQKTGRPLRVPLNQTAKEWMPDRKGTKPTENVFSLTCLSACDRCLKKLAQAAGITKTVSFHISRHTFATLALAAGGDIATVSNLLGHRSLRSTQIYADVVMETKIEAVNRMTEFFSNTK